MMYRLSLPICLAANLDLGDTRDWAESAVTLLSNAISRLGVRPPVRVRTKRGIPKRFRLTKPRHWRGFRFARGQNFAGLGFRPATTLLIST